MLNSFVRNKVAPRISTLNMSISREQLRGVMDKRCDMEFELCIPAVPVSNPAVAGFGFSITIILMVLCI